MKLSEMFGGRHIGVVGGEWSPGDDYNEMDDPEIMRLYHDHAPEGMSFEEWRDTDEAEDMISDLHYDARERRADPYAVRGLSRRDFY